MAAIPVVSDGQTILAAHHDAIATELNGPWTSFTPALTGSVTNPTLGTGSIATGRYKVLASGLVVGQAQIVFGTSGTAAGSGIMRVSFPVAGLTPQSPATGLVIGTAWLADSSTATCAVAVLRQSTATTALMACHGGSNTGANQAVPIPWAASDQIQYQFEYEPA